MFHSFISKQGEEGNLNLSIAHDDGKSKLQDLVEDHFKFIKSEHFNFLIQLLQCLLWV